MTGLDTLTSALAGGTAALAAGSPPVDVHPAAVLVLLSPVPDLTYVERAHTLRAHPGQLAFPGGRLDDGEGPVEAALRETWEEVCLPPGEVTVLGSLAAHLGASRPFNVTAVVGRWDGQTPIRAGDPAEVADVHRFSVDDLADPANRVTAVLDRAGQVHRTPAFVMGDLFLWGYSAYLTDLVLRLGGWARPWDESRVSPVPERFARR